MSSETIGRSTETLRHGAGLLDDIADRGVVKHEDHDDEIALQNQIAVQSCLCHACVTLEGMHQTRLCKNRFVLYKKGRIVSST